MRTYALAVVASLLLCCMPANAAVRALVVGIDKYESKQQLGGSVNDARDFAKTLTGAGADVTTLIDKEATRAAFDRTWNRIVDRSAPGDIIFLSFSGHGIRSPEVGALTTPDGYQKGFLLQPYNERERSEEILRDEDLYDRFAVATARGVHIFFVADACHAGAAVRGLDPRGKTSFRFQRFDTSAQPVIVPPDVKVVARPENPGVTIFSATDEKLSIQEVVAGSELRGALSYAVARGLEAISGGTGKATVGDLKRYVSPLVRELSGNRQIPRFIIPDESLDVLYGTAGEERPTTQGMDLPPIRMSVLGTGELPAFVGVEFVDRGAELVWDATRRQIVDANGDVIQSDITLEAVQSAIDARRVLNMLRGRVALQREDAGTRVGGDTNPDGRRFFVKDETVEIRMDPGEFGYATMFNFNASGTVQLMWPIISLGDAEGGSVSQPTSFFAPVTGPYGADYVVTILSREPLVALQKELELLHNSVSPWALLSAIRKAMAANELRIGINSIFSCETLRSNGQCESMLTFAA